MYDHDTTDDTSVQALATLQSIARVLEEIRANQASEANSSAQISTSTRGYDITVKCYVGSDVRPAADQAMSEWLRMRAEMERRLMGGQEAG